MELVSLKCPDCGAHIHVESGEKICFCSHCGAQLKILDPDNQTVTVIDVAKIKEVESKERIRRKELNLKTLGGISDRLGKIIKGFCVFILACTVISVISDPDIILSLIVLFITALPIALIVLLIVFIIRRLSK